MIKSIFFLTLLMIVVSNYTYANSESKLLDTASNIECQNSVNELVGRLIKLREQERSYENGTDAFGAGPALSRLIDGYQTIQTCMSKRQKIEFFWIMLWHSDFDGEMKFYLKFVNEEVGSDFLSKATKYKNSLEKYKRSKGRQHKIKAVILDLENLNH